MSHAHNNRVCQSSKRLRHWDFFPKLSHRWVSSFLLDFCMVRIHFFAGIWIIMIMLHIFIAFCAKTICIFKMFYLFSGVAVNTHHHIKIGCASGPTINRWDWIFANIICREVNETDRADDIDFECFTHLNSLLKGIKRSPAMISKMMAEPRVPKNFKEFETK